MWLCNTIADKLHFNITVLFIYLFSKVKGLSCNYHPSWGGPTRCSGLWDGLVDAGAKAAADGNVTGGVVGLAALVPQLLLSPPLCSSVREPDLQ